MRLTSFSSYLRLALWATLALHLPYSLHGQCYTCIDDDCSGGCTYLITGTVSNPSYNLNHASDKLCIAPGAVVTGNWNVNLNHSDATVVNCGTIRTTTGLNWNQGRFINHGRLEIGQSLTINGGQWANYRLLDVTTDLNINGSSVRFCNHDSVIVRNNFNAAGEVQNNYVFQVMRHFQQNTGTFCTQQRSLVHARDFTTQAHVEGPPLGDGCALFMIGQYSTVNASGGLDGSIDFCDSTPPPSSPYVDNVSGTIGSNVKFCTCTVVLSAEQIRWRAEQINQGVRLSAEAPEGVAWRRIRILRSHATEPLTLLAELTPAPLPPGQSWQWTDRHLPSSNSPLTYQVQWLGADGQWAQSQRLMVRPSLHCSQWEGIIHAGPEGTFLQLSLPRPGLIRLTLIDQQGRVMWQSLQHASANDQVALPCLTLPAGLYLLRAIYGGERRSWRWLNSNF
jgi:hypothetical protein